MNELAFLGTCFVGMRLMYVFWCAKTFSVFLLEILPVELYLHTVLQQGLPLGFERLGCLVFLPKEVLRPSANAVVNLQTDQSVEFVLLVEAEEKARIGLGAFHPEHVVVVADVCLEPVYAALG